MAAVTKYSPEEFKKFLWSILKKGHIKDSFIEKILAPPNLAEFKIAFTHWSADHIKNYERYEYLGDVIINEFVVSYINKRYPLITSVKWLTRIKHNLVGNKFLARLTEKEGLLKYVIYGKEVQELIANKDKNIKGQTEYKRHYYAMLEDIMEAFFGCLVLTIEKLGKKHGTAIELANNILQGFFDAVDIPLGYEDVFDYVTRTKELYEFKQKGLLWPFDQAFETRKIEDGIFEVSIYGWPLGDKTPIDKNMVKLATETGDKKDAKQTVCKRALEILKTKYGITELVPDKYEIIQKTKWSNVKKADAE